MQPPRTLSEAVTHFLRRYDNPHSRHAYESVLRPFVESYGPAQPLTAITPEALDDWHYHMRQRGNAPATINSRTRHMRAFWNWCVKRGYIDISPARFLEQIKEELVLETKAIPTETMDAMLKAAMHRPNEFLRLRDTAILALLVTYGARCGDVASLRLPRINFQERWIVLYAKGRKENLLPLPPDTGWLLAQWVEHRLKLAPDPDHDLCFVTIRKRDGNRHQPLTPGGIQSMFRRLSQAMSDGSYGPHSARHLRGKLNALAGVPEHVTQNIMNHSDPNTTRQYSRVGFVEAARVLDQHELLPDIQKAASTNPEFWKERRIGRAAY